MLRPCSFFSVVVYCSEQSSLHQNVKVLRCSFCLIFFYWYTSSSGQAVSCCRCQASIFRSTVRRLREKPTVFAPNQLRSRLTSYALSVVAPVAYCSISAFQVAGCRQWPNNARPRFRYLFCLGVQLGRLGKNGSPLPINPGKASGGAVGTNCDSRNSPNSTSSNWPTDKAGCLDTEER